MKLSIECAGGNDLYAERVACNCINPDYKDDPVLGKLIQKYIRLSGYNDANFFDHVNKQPQNGQCSCGRKFTYQWFHTHVEFEWDK